MSGSDAPVIGLTTYLEVAKQGVWEVPAAYLQQTYLHAVTHAGGIPVLLPPQPLENDSAERALERIDALVLTGGRDVEASHYGETPHETADEPRPDRDAWELELLRAALDRDMPVLGICRGAQLLNVALGGSLVQHLPDETGDDLHRAGTGVFAWNEVSTVPGSLIASILGEQVKVTCYHHQAVSRLAPGLQVSARTADGVVEAVELPDRSFVLAVQWHPEETYQDTRIMAALVDAARRRSGRPQPFAPATAEEQP